MASKFAGNNKSKGRASSFARAAAKSAPAEDRGEEFDPGTYRVKLKEVYESDNGSFGITFTGVGADEDLGDRIQWFSTKGKSVHVSGPRIKTLCMALLGLGAADVDEYNAFDPNGEFVDAILKFDLDAAAEYLAENGQAKNADKAREALEEAEVIIKVTKGGEKDDGGFFKNATFKPAGDEDDSDDSEEDEDDDAPESEPAPRGKKKAAAKRKPSRDEDEDEDDSDDGDEEDDSEEDEDDEPPPRKSKASKKAKGRK